MEIYKNEIEASLNLLAGDELKCSTIYFLALLNSGFGVSSQILKENIFNFLELPQPCNSSFSNYFSLLRGVFEDQFQVSFKREELRYNWGKTPLDLLSVAIGYMSLSSISPISISEILGETQPTLRHEPALSRTVAVLAQFPKIDHRPSIANCRGIQETTGLDAKLVSNRLLRLHEQMIIDYDFGRHVNPTGTKQTITYPSLRRGEEERELITILIPKIVEFWSDFTDGHPDTKKWNRQFMRQVLFDSEGKKRLAQNTARVAHPLYRHNER